MFFHFTLLLVSLTLVLLPTKPTLHLPAELLLLPSFDWLQTRAMGWVKAGVRKLEDWTSKSMLATERKRQVLMCDVCESRNKGEPLGDRHDGWWVWYSSITFVSNISFIFLCFSTFVLFSPLPIRRLCIFFSVRACVYFYVQIWSYVFLSVLSHWCIWNEMRTSPSSSSHPSPSFSHILNLSSLYYTKIIFFLGAYALLYSNGLYLIFIFTVM